MFFSSLELTLMAGLFSALGAIVAGVVIRVMTGASFVTQSECAARHASDCKMNTDLNDKIDEVRTGQEKFQAAMAMKNGHMFRMLRAIVVYMDIPQEQKERILNERSGN